MRYQKTRWLHSFADEPVLIYSELNADRWEVRKVEQFADGRFQWADATTPDGAPTALGLTPIPAMVEIAEDPQFRVDEIDAAEFQAVWEAAGGPRH